MIVINYLSLISVPFIIFFIVVYGLHEKVKVYDLFIEGAKEGIEMAISLIPALIGVFLVVGLLRNSGIIDLIVNFASPITNLINYPKEILPLSLLRPVSGSASMAVATDIMNTYGVDSNLGLIASTIMGSTETTLYIIAIYTSAVGIKNIRFVLIAALIADVVGMLISVAMCRFLS